jgi:hypothetical protein
MSNLPLQRNRRYPTPALDLWRRELAQGHRTVTTFDAVWAAACRESWALEAPDDATAARYLTEASGILRDAAKGAT